jgi:hypothetical protein
VILKSDFIQKFYLFLVNGEHYEIFEYSLREQLRRVEIRIKTFFIVYVNQFFLINIQNTKIRRKVLSK